MKKYMKGTSIREHGGCTLTAKVKNEKQVDVFGGSLDLIDVLSENEDTVNSTEVDEGLNNRGKSKPYR